MLLDGRGVPSHGRRYRGAPYSDLQPYESWDGISGESFHAGFGLDVESTHIHAECGLGFIVDSNFAPKVADARRDVFPVCGRLCGWEY